MGATLLFWPRGAAVLLRENLAAAYARSADYVGAAARQAIGGGDLARSASAAQAAAAAVHESLAHATAAPPPQRRNTEGRRRLLECVREAVAGGDKTQLRPALVLPWVSQHLDELWRLESQLGRDAFASGSEIRGAEMVLGSVPGEV
jgi:hypothetical protein